MINVEGVAEGIKFRKLQKQFHKAAMVVFRKETSHAMMEVTLHLILQMLMISLVKKRMGFAVLQQHCNNIFTSLVQ